MGLFIVPDMGTSIPITLWFYKILKTSELVEQLLDSQEGYNYIEFVKDPLRTKIRI
jgi:hypothetical protein